ncbi:hypothetical protein G6F57_002525 [Rhizopus arrhizus]|uniref:Uncharacterized protein n=1 Tax=Rhizopus oryzae TaxID=64495 RepID=A0A9P6XB69_RHIOR|nr:hypothetical protein G6F23_001205 [Rhizopus arrhizus]KAG1425467.1 hypothetical protein G6F58_001899 [Rhizopus delemar]KAG0767641.1 hypothetical protein G6F24_002617 [Rhizopus arrhizus]KAG0797101.1 hypothetical protein G6F21_000795 [Rhizopus arrhizus]KAG0812551.1 hypothetical protein G6F20_006272 [Rhizopus arrhizus]
MSTEPAYQHSSLKSLSETTLKLIKHAQPLVIPEAHELLSMRSDLEALLPISKNRVEDLKRDLRHVDENVKINDNEEVSEDNMKIKQEPDDFSDELFIPNTEQLSQQTSLDINKKRKRQDIENTSEAMQRKSESPYIKTKQPEGKAPPNQMKKKKQDVIEEVDFIRVKAKDQVPVSTFWTNIDPYFRPLTEQDRQFLLEKSDTGKPYLIPPLGEHYLNQWKKEDKILMQQQPSNQAQSTQLAEPVCKDMNSESSLIDRLLSSLVAEDVIDPSELAEVDQSDVLDEETDQFGPTLEIADFEERLRRELWYAGLLDEKDVNWDKKEDDEICAELRSLAREYREQVKINDSRKKKLLEIVDCQLQFEQYRQVLDTLDNQVEQGYIKRYRHQKTKKHKAGKSALPVMHAMDRRNTWISALKDIFKDKNLVMPSKTIYSSTEGH